MKTQKRIQFGILSILLLVGVAIAAHGGVMEEPIPWHYEQWRQTPTPLPVIPSNLPTAYSVSNSTIDVSVGVVLNAGGAVQSVENIVMGRYHFTQNFFVGAELQNGAASSLIDKTGLHFGIAKRWDTAEIYGLAGARRNFASVDPSGATRASWEAQGGGGFSYFPFNASGTTVLRQMGLFSEAVVIYRIHGQNRPEIENRTGIRYYF